MREKLGQADGSQGKRTTVMLPISIGTEIMQVHEYYALQHQFKLSIAVEFINRDDFNHLLEYERKVEVIRPLSVCCGMDSD